MLPEMFCKFSKTRAKSERVLAFLVQNKVFRRKFRPEERSRTILHDIFYYRLQKPLALVCTHYLDPLRKRVDARAKRVSAQGSLVRSGGVRPASFAEEPNAFLSSRPAPRG